MVSLVGSISISDINGLVQERCNSSASTMELCLSCINPLIVCLIIRSCAIFAMDHSEYSGC